MTNIPEFIVESIDTSDALWEFFNDIQRLDDENQDPHARFAKKFTSMATTATIFRWKFGEQHDDPTIETTLNPYIHKFHGHGTYLVSHQSCAPCLSMDPPLVCSNGWCTKEIIVEEPIEHGSDSLIATAGLFGLFIIAKSHDCCDIRRRCMEKLAICDTVKPEDIENKKACTSIRELCENRLKDCKKKCTKTQHQWDKSHEICHEKGKSHDVICQTIENKKTRRIDKNDQKKIKMVKKDKNTTW
jgi:hypothetical protein